MSHLNNKVVLVTGGSDGIGKALVDALIHAGAKVSTCGRDYDKLYELQRTYAGKPLIAFSADISNETDCKTLIENTVSTFGTIDILINNAGISMRALFSETDLETLRKVMNVNFWGTVFCTKYALPYIMRQMGTIVAVSTIAGYRGLPGRSGYSASKFAVNGWMEALRTELLSSGVNVMWVCPGFTASNIRHAALNKDASPQGETTMDESKMMSAEECARHILHAVEKRKRSIILTAKGKQTVFMNYFFPSLTDKLVRKFFFKNDELVK